MQKTYYGTMPDGTAVYCCTLKNPRATARILTYGGILTDFTVDGHGVVLGYDTLEDYLADTSSYLGSLVGRYANRIAKGRFTLNGVTYQLACNDGANHLHGGTVGYNRRVWEIEDGSDDFLTLTLDSPDGEEGYPGHARIRVTYRLCGNALAIDYTATTDADTPLNLTNHSYFNLKGPGESILDCKARIASERVSHPDAGLIPDGTYIPTRGTQFDFTVPKEIGAGWENGFNGYDHNFVLSPGAPEQICGYSLPAVAEVTSDKLKLTVYTDQKHLQFYIGTMFTGAPALRGGVAKAPYTGFCMEAQEEPDSPNHGKAILKAGDTYRQTTVYRVDTL